MKKLFAIAATAAALSATPAFANEGYILGRASYDAAEIDTSDVDGIGDIGDIDLGKGAGFGVAAGYDLDLGPQIFIGGEIGIDASTAKEVFGGTEAKAGREISTVGRLGFKASEKIKLYGLAGYVNGQIKIDDAGDEVSDTGNGVVYGAGASVGLGSQLLGSIEYRRSTYNISDDAGDVGDLNKSRVIFSLGLRF